MIIIAPNRQDALVSENGIPSIRFSDVLESLVDTVNSLVARSVNTQDLSYTFLITDALSIVLKTSTTTNQKYTIPSNDSVAFDIGTVLEVQNDGSVSLDVAIDTDTLTFEADATLGTRTIAAAGSGRFVKVADTAWKARGENMT